MDLKETLCRRVDYTGSG